MLTERTNCIVDPEADISGAEHVPWMAAAAQAMNKSGIEWRENVTMIVCIIRWSWQMRVLA